MILSPTFQRLIIDQVLLFNVWRVIEKKKTDIFFQAKVYLVFTC